MQEAATSWDIRSLLTYPSLIVSTLGVLFVFSYTDY